MSRQLGAVIATTLTTLAAFTSAAHASPPEVDNIAHRGASAYAPENTLAACALARSQRADTCELDVQQTKDDHLVLMHDQTLTRTTNVEQVFPDRSPWRVSDFTLAEIKRLDAGSWFSSHFRGERVPTLREALRESNGGIGLLLEVKHSPRNPDIDRRVAAELQETRSWWSSRRLAVQAFDWQSMRTFHSLMPQVPIALLGKPDLDKLTELAGFAKALNLPHSELTAQYVKSVHDKGMRVYTWRAQKRAVIRRLISYGVDGIMTNRPDHLHGVKHGR
ncbi:glycerophosphodiester phosphodiesterase [Nonomuraea sp. K274]|uniref:Glycerophosphodiester phosphodiesterase n=1 Tax=Nonomuraea cypriaca TaxID=1187855 RepID=A0A931ADX2_9ACTN|nr:glycerophosphodiester phosphodiesterase family protein [Nonomuraea cypriaca]MBF8191172.1 glycerophosphodiester phosphodiesterase [Nonomuraea cypriaca]